MQKMRICSVKLRADGPESELDEDPLSLIGPEELQEGGDQGPFRLRDVPIEHHGGVLCIDGAGWRDDFIGGQSASKISDGLLFIRHQHVSEADVELPPRSARRGAENGDIPPEAAQFILRVYGVGWVST